MLKVTAYEQPMQIHTDP